MNFKYNIHKCEVQCNAFTAVWFSFSSVFLLASSFWMLLFACLHFVLYVHVLHFLNSLLMLSMVEFGALVGLLEVEVPVCTGIAVLSAVSFTESLPFMGGAALAINVVLKQSDVQVYSASS